MRNRQLCIAGVVAAASAFGTARAIAQQSAMPFDAPAVVIDEFHRFDELLDFDGDGDADAIGYWPRTDHELVITAFRNDGTGRLVETWTHTFPFETCQNCVPPAFTVGDVDTDGRDDFVLSRGVVVTVFLSRDPDGFVLGREWVEPSIQYPKNMAIADFDGDGSNDLFLRQPNSVTIHFNEGLEAPMERVSAATSFAADQVAVGELDGDGLADVLLSGGQIRPIGAANRVIAIGASLGLDWDGMTAVGDLDGDGDDDIVDFDLGATYTIHRRVGPSAFVLEGSAAGGPATRLADVDGDGDLDGICCGGGGGGGGDGLNRNLSTSYFHIAINRGGGNFAPAFRFLGVGSRRIAGATDLDADGDADLVAGRCIYYGRGPIVDPYVRLGREASQKRPADVDGDGDPDWMPARDGFLANAGDGGALEEAMAQPPPPAGSTWYSDGFPGDFDGDGDVDLLVNRRASGNSLGFHWWWNRGGVYQDGGLATASFLGAVAPQFVDSWGTADFDDDGDRDLFVYTLAGGATARLWINESGVELVRGLELTNEPMLHAADVDGDGISDLITLSTGLLSFRSGRGNASFGPPQPIGAFKNVRPETASRQIVDFDGDGDLDVLGELGDAAWIYANDGSGAFSPALRLARPVSEGRTLAVDFDGDADLDVLAGPAPGGLGSLVFRSNGPGIAFDPPVTQVFFAAAAADVDGDGDVDVLSDDVHFSSVYPELNLHPDHVITCCVFDEPAAGSRVQFGPRLAGAGGIAPILGAVGPFRVGESHEIRLHCGVGGARAWLAIGGERGWTESRGGVFLVSPPRRIRVLELDGPDGVPGAGSLVLRRRTTPARFAGRTFVMQAAVRDAAAPEGIAWTNGLELRFGE